MKNENNISEFDNFFKQQLEGASATPPVGVWETVSSSIASGTSSVVVAKAALWLKLSVAVIAATVVVSSVYFLTKDATPTSVSQPLQVVASEPAIQAEPKIASEIVVPQETNGANIERSKIPSKLEAKARNKEVEKASVKVKLLPAEVKAKPSKDQNNLNFTPSLQLIKDLEKQAEIKVAENKPKLDSVPTPFLAVRDNYVAKKPDSTYLFIPDVVTPNGDGLNDEYFIDIKGEESVKITIRDLKYNIIFETDNKHQPWNCIMLNGEVYREGSYLVTVIYKFPNLPSVNKTIKLKLIR
ncbi:MAG: gliding motility-associated C-terminal domain-containing protein [bacterium]|nr:gliding motility-associated C-terminal domain-containing protein [bacterium]